MSNLHKLRTIYESSEKTYNQSKKLFLSTIRKHIRNSKDYKSDCVLDHFYISGDYDDFDLYYVKTGNFRMEWYKNNNRLIPYYIKDKASNSLEKIISKQIYFYDNNNYNYVNFYFDELGTWTKEDFNKFN